MKESISRKSAAKVYKIINQIQSCTLNEVVLFDKRLACRWSKHDLRLLQTAGKPRSSLWTGEEIYYGFFFFGVSNEIYIVSLEQFPTWEIFNWVKASEIKDLTCASESNVDADVTVPRKKKKKKKKKKSVRESYSKIYRAKEWQAWRLVWPRYQRKVALNISC